MIVKAWGDWELFQTLLQTLRTIGNRHHGRSIANIATRWILDHPFVGAVLVGESLPDRLSNSFLSLDLCFSFHLHLSVTYVCVCVIISDCTGVRLGLSEHADDNQRAFGFRLSKQDSQDIEDVLQRSNSRRMITTIGDCGAEYRQY